MGDFNSAVEKVLIEEGGFVDNVNDSGGATNYGVSLRFLREIPIERMRKYGIFKTSEELNTEDVKNLTEDQAKLIYKGEFWESAPFELIINQDICDYIFDCSVVHGTSQAIKIAQRAIWAVYQNINYQDVTDDGMLGKLTITAINATTSKSMLIALMAERAGYMRLIASERAKDREFSNGWLKRCYRV